MLELLAALFDSFGDLIIILWAKKLLRRWKKNQEWSGVVIKKKRKQEHSSSKFRYVVVFRKKNGRRKRLRMDEWQASFYKPGWMYTKKKGEDLPDYNSGMEYFG